jgi:predicted nucleic acid-binding protein
VLTELRELPEKMIAIKNGINDVVIDRFIFSLLQKSEFLDIVKDDFHHPIDPDDSCYVNLALTGDASIIVSRDRHLLGLNDATKPWSADFRARFPTLRIIPVEQFLKEWDAKTLKSG